MKFTGGEEKLQERYKKHTKAVWSKGEHTVQQKEKASLGKGNAEVQPA